MTDPRYPFVSSKFPVDCRGIGERCHEAQPPFPPRLAAGAGACGGLVDFGRLPDDDRRSDAAVGLLPARRPAVLPARTRIQAFAAGASPSLAAPSPPGPRCLGPGPRSPALAHPP